MQKILFLDVDGCLTDGRVIYLDSGERGRFFSVVDGEGVRQLQAAGWWVIFVSGEDDPHMRNRAEKLGVGRYFGETDKAAVLRNITDQFEDSIYTVWMGDDMSDLPAMELADLAACPDNAEIPVFRYVSAQRLGDNGFISDRSGGDGAVRDLCNFLLNDAGVPREQA